MRNGASSVSFLISDFARRACELMDIDLRRQFVDFINGYKDESGGFRGRSSANDLYYTFFGLECLRALKERISFSKMSAFLKTYEHKKARLDFIHLASLMRCLTRFPSFAGEPHLSNLHGLLGCMERFRFAHGGFRLNCTSKSESIYAGFIALMIYEELHRPMPDPQGLLQGIEKFSTADGAYAEVRGLQSGTTTVTSAAAILKHSLGGDPCLDLGDWLLRQFDHSGGCKASPDAPFADLLSTATSLIALKIIGVPLHDIRDNCLRYIEDLWHADGGFRGCVMDDTADVEYTYYGFISLGILAGE